MSERFVLLNSGLDSAIKNTLQFTSGAEKQTYERTEHLYIPLTGRMTTGSIAPFSGALLRIGRWTTPILGLISEGATANSNSNARISTNNKTFILDRKGTIFTGQICQGHQCYLIGRKKKLTL